MMPPERQQNSHSSYEAALESLMGDLEEAQNEVRAKRVALAIAEARVHELAQLAMKLVEMVRPHDRADHRHRIAASLQPLGRGSRGATAIYANIVDLLTSTPGRQWSAAEAHAELVARGIPSDPEQVHNVFQYLARKQRIERVSRGRYQVGGKGAA